MRLVVTLLFLVSPSLWAGGRDGGGGNICFLNKQPVLLDLAQSQAGIETSLSFAQSPGYQYAPTTFLKAAGIDDAKIDGTVLAWVKHLLENQQSETASEILYTIVERLPLYLTDYDVSKSFRPDFYKTPLCNRSNTRAVIFNKSIMFLNINIWNKLSIFTQAAVLIHEAIRFMQIIDDSISDPRVQDLTYQLIMNPGSVDLDKELIVPVYKRHPYYYLVYGHNVCVARNLDVASLKSIRSRLCSSKERSWGEQMALMEEFDKAVANSNLGSDTKKFVREARDYLNNTFKTSFTKDYFIRTLDSLRLVDGQMALGTYGILKAITETDEHPSFGDAINPLFWIRRSKTRSELQNSLRPAIIQLIESQTQD